jgi:hypothetical protein
MTLVRSVKARMTYCLVVVNSSFSSSLTPFSGLGGIRKYSAASSFRGSDLLGFLHREVYDGWHRACGLGSCDEGKGSRQSLSFLKRSTKRMYRGNGNHAPAR